METSDKRGATLAVAARVPWVAPRYTRLRAGDAEVGPNPVLADGSFTTS